MPLNSRYYILMSGSGMLWGWGFLHFFFSQFAAASGDAYTSGDLLYLGSTLLVSILVAVMASNTNARALSSHLARLGCLLLVVGTLLDSTPLTFGSATSEVHLLSMVLLGSGMGLFWIAWGNLYVRAETESVESSFMGWFPLLVVLLAIAAGIRALGDSASLLYSALLLLLPCASLACFHASERHIDEQGAGTPELDDHVERGAAGDPVREGIVRPMLNLVCVFASTNLAWNAFLGCADLGFERLIVLFGVGIVILFFIIWLALHTTRHFSLSTLYRWALPLMAIGVVLYQLFGADAVVPVFLCMAIVNTGFEVMGKLFIVYTAKRLSAHAVAIIAVGFATATVGGLIGMLLWNAALGWFRSNATGGALLCALVVFVVAASVALGKDYDARDGMRHPLYGAIDGTGADTASRKPPAEETITTLDSVDTGHKARCLAIAERHGLSARETDVLFLLSQGRSRAYIRETLYISKGTVDAHIHHIYSKVGISSKDELMRLFD